MGNEDWCGGDWLGEANERGARFAGKRRISLLQGVQFLGRTPVLPGTVFGLELLLHQAQIDVGVATELVLNDVGAVIQILNRAGRVESRTALEEDRIAECLVTLNLGDLLSGLYRRTIATGGVHVQAVAVWEHCRMVASYASIIAESAGEISAEDAYLAGLLDDRGAIAAVLGWPLRSRKRVGAGELLAAGEMLPRSIRPAFAHTPAFPRPKEWRYILDGAHELAGPLTAPAPSGTLIRG